MPIRVLVVDDSLTVRKRLVEIVSADRELSVVADTGDGQRAVELCRSLRPDVVSLDMMLPTMTGVEVTEHLMAYLPTPILIVSASTNRGELLRTYDALAAGAIDVLEKPDGNRSDEAWIARYTRTLKLVARIKVVTHPRAKLRDCGFPSVRTAPAPRQPEQQLTSGRVLAIGGSTGGPGAIAHVLRS